MTLLLAALLGIGLGVVTGMPIGVVNVAIVDAANRAPRFATGIGIGGAIADALHAAVAFLGIGHLVTTQPALVRGFAIGAACLIVGYAILAWRAQDRVAPTARDDRRLSRGIATGFVLTLPNPGALAAWVAVAATLWPTATPAEAIALALGVGAGSAAWFAALARWVGRLAVDHPARRVLPKLALVVLVGIAIAGIARTL